MFTLEQLCTAGVLTAWNVAGPALPIRTFYYTNLWANAFNMFSDEYDRKLLEPAIPVRSNLAALVDRYVDGTPCDQMIWPVGPGQPPIWKRMRAPNLAVVECRTYDTRTFGFFSRPNVYVACTVSLTDLVKQQKLYGACAMQVQKLIARIALSEIDGVTDVEHLVTD